MRATHTFSITMKQDEADRFQALADRLTHGNRSELVRRWLARAMDEPLPEWARIWPMADERKEPGE